MQVCRQVIIDNKIISEEELERFHPPPSPDKTFEQIEIYPTQATLDYSTRKKSDSTAIRLT